MSVQPGYKTLIKIDTKILCGRRNVSMDLTADMAEGTTGESTNQWKEYVPMFKGMEFSMDGLFDPDSSGEKVSDAIVLLKNGTMCTVYYGGTEVGDKYEEASAYINSVNITGPYDDLKSYTLGITVTGEPITKIVE